MNMNTIVSFEFILSSPGKVQGKLQWLYTSCQVSAKLLKVYSIPISSKLDPNDNTFWTFSCLLPVWYYTISFLDNVLHIAIRLLFLVISLPRIFLLPLGRLFICIYTRPRLNATSAKKPPLISPDNNYWLLFFDHLYPLFVLFCFLFFEFSSIEKNSALIRGLRGTNF